MDPGGKIYTIDEFRCWKVENLDDQRSDENKKREISQECNDIIGSAKGSQICEKY